MADASANDTAKQAADAMGGMVMGETKPFPDDPNATDQSDDIASIFGLGEEAGPVSNLSESGTGGGASPPSATPAADGGGEQSKPAASPTPQTQPGQQGEPQPPAPASPQPAAPAAAPEPAQGPAPDQSVQALVAQVQALIAQNAQLQASLTQGVGQAPQTGPGEQQGQQPADPYLDYRLVIPDDVAGAIFNEDPTVARQGLSHLINSLGRVVHERVIRSVTEHVLPQRLSEFQGNLSLTQQQEQMRSDYYRDFPQHNDPGIKLVVAQEAQAMWAANPAQAWDTNARAALGARVNARLGYANVQAQGQQQQPNPQVTPAPRPAAQMGASTRPPVDSGDNEGNFIHDILSA